MSRILIERRICYGTKKNNGYPPPDGRQGLSRILTEHRICYRTKNNGYPPPEGHKGLFPGLFLVKHTSAPPQIKLLRSNSNYYHLLLSLVIEMCAQQNYEREKREGLFFVCIS